MARRSADADTVDEGLWGSPRRRLPLSGSFVVDGLMLVVGVLVVSTLVGLALLWPHGKLGRVGQFGPIRTIGGVAERVKTVPCELSASHSCRVADVKLLDGPQKGHVVQLTTVAAVGSLDVGQGDRIRVYKTNLPPGAGTTRGNAYSFADFDRRGAMLWLSIGFVVLLLLTGRLRGFRALVGLLGSLVIVVEFVVPAILHGSSPLAVAIVGAFTVMLAALLAPRMTDRQLGAAEAHAHAH